MNITIGHILNSETQNYEDVTIKGSFLRDWFAGQALSGIITHDLSGSTKAEIIGIAYEYADEMMVAREADHE